MTATPLSTSLRRALPATLALVGAALLAPSVATAAPVAGAPISLDGEAPKHLAVAADGTLWLTLDSASSDVARVKDGVVTKFNDPAVTNVGGIAIDAAGDVWITRTGGVSKFSPSDPANMTETAIPAISSPRKIVAARDGNLYTASDDRLIRIPAANPAGFNVRTFPTMSATSIAAASNGELWITNFGGEQIIRATPNGEPITIPAGGNPQDIAAGADGLVAIAMPSAPHRVSLRTAAGEVAAPAVAGDPFGIAYAADGAFWTARFAGHAVSRVSATGEVTSIPMPAASGPRYIAAGANTVWVGLETAQAVLPITGVEAPVPGPGPGPSPGPGQVTPDVTAPVISEPLLLRKRFRAGKKLKPPTPGKRGVGTRLSFTLSEQATVSFAVQKPVSGRRSGADCVKPTKKLAKAKRCTRWVPAGTLLRDELSGTVNVSLYGRVKGKNLKPSQYRLVVTAVDAAGNRSQPLNRRITITRT